MRAHRSDAGIAATKCGDGSVTEHIENAALLRTVAEWREKVRASGMRAWPEWIGKSGDTAIPGKVQARIVLLWGNVCYLTGVKIIGKPDFEHVIPLHAGGENREGNIRPASKAAHKGKSSEEQKRKAKADRARIAAVATIKPKATIPRPPKPEKPARDKLPLPARTHDIFGGRL